MRRKIYCVLLFLFAVWAQAQEAPKPKLWNVKLNVTQLVDVLNFPTLQLSLERKINLKFSVLAEGGLQLYDVVSKPDTTINKAKGYKVNCEFRMYIFQTFNPKRYNKPGLLFIGVQPYYRYNERTFSISYRKDDSNEQEIPQEPRESFTDDFGVKRKIYGVNATVGFQHHFAKRLVLEPSIAFGSLYRKARNTERSYNPETDVTFYDHDIGDIKGSQLSEKNGGGYVNFTINFRIGYKF